jgi:hypothetical protein
MPFAQASSTSSSPFLHHHFRSLGKSLEPAALHVAAPELTQKTRGDEDMMAASDAGNGRRLSVDLVGGFLSSDTVFFFRNLMIIFAGGGFRTICERYAQISVSNIHLLTAR